MSANDSTDAKGKIVAAVRKRWEERKLAYLLSQLGIDFAADVASISGGRKLRAVIEQDFRDSLRLESDPVKLWGVVPNEVPKDQLGSAFGGEVSSVPKFLRPVWAAFRKPLAPGHHRFLAKSDKGYYFVDQDGNEQPPPSVVFAVPPNEISPDKAPNPEVGEKIRTFIESSGLELQDYLARPFGQTSDVAVPHGTEHPHGSALDILLSALSPSDQRRITLPLDVVGKLRNHPAGQR